MKSSNTRVPPPLEALKVKTFTLIWLIVQESTEEQKMLVLWVKGQMLIPEWAVIALRIQLWPTLICKKILVMMTLTVLTLSSKNCIDKI